MAKKIFIIGFSTPILRDVALQLQTAGIDIVYWQGYRDYFKSIMQDKEHFPKTIFHYANDAIRNIPPVQIDTSSFDPVGQEMLVRLQPYYSNAFLLISRIDYTGWSLVRKRNLYYQYISFWQGMLKKFRPDAIIFPDVPHSGNNYVLYALAKILHIHVIIMEQIGVETRTLLIDDYEMSSTALRDDYQINQDKACRVEDLSVDLQSYYRQHVNPRADATPQYQKRALQRKAPFRTPTLKIIIKHISHLTFFSVTFSYLRMLWMENEEQTLGAPMRGFQYKFMINKWVRINRSLAKKYEHLQKQPGFSKKFVYLPLSFQPERTTCPQAGMFDDQLLIIETVARSLPTGWTVYVKENPGQLRPANFFSHMYRYDGYYERIVKLGNVQLVPVETSTYDLIENAQAIAVGTGTAGWEALLRSKPVLVFGFVWYMYCDGVFRVSDVALCQAALKKIQEGGKPDTQKVLNYLAALDRNSMRARHFRTLFYRENDYGKSDYISHEDNVSNLTKALYESLTI
ncbi:hypothetical protein A2477_03865 [Candidatus Falkowbacteria bacterium RIFOXYC2_FULL_47_12]|uniref:Capsule polysaccharide biosynthesis protein n=2 Tax=Candidatus Falkowiibacteriota TaxID=1752728 RepID=A0A1F5TNN7_9BACT|nr:MAG: hypothetical protein A2242_04470 [Candidatus Falkowbacteria bacterium RIFOXYA2_FULL_47_9]OGF40612.1 MAG: hypothetical protein A2477_03865 [Candidatus Falkowbacteria bacterium RIFOXYC2_FULL_47_12]